jgi:hypothetical protein
MRFSLAQLTRRQRNPRRSAIVIRDIIPTAVQASDLYGIYRPVIDRWASTIAPLMAEYERTLAAVTTDSAADLNNTLDATEGEIQRLLYLLTPRLRDFVLRQERWFRDRWVGAVLSATGVDLSTLIGVEDARETIEAAIARNISLVKDVSRQAQARMSESIFRGLTNRTPAREVAAELREAVAMGRRRSVNIASHQLSAITGSLADERRRQAGLSEWEWVHSRKARPRAAHVARNGNIYTDDPAKVGKTINGKVVMALPPTRPSEEPFCGCRAKAILDLS